jgi:DNA-binding transcriptional LysR family regulator
MRIEQLEYLLKISQMNTMTHAANALHISQPSLSEAIKRLENELDITLLERHHQGVSLTEAGECVVHTAERIFEELYIMQHQLDAIKKQSPQALKTISLDVTPFLGNTYLFQFWRHCQDVHHWDIKIELYDAQKILDRIIAGISSIGIILIEEQYLQEISRKHPDLCFHRLLFGHLQAFFSENHPLEAYKTIPVEELLKYPLLFLKNDCIPLQAILKNQCKEVPNSLIESDIYILPQHFIKNKLGVSLISSILLEYFPKFPFDLQQTVVKDISLYISSDLYVVMDGEFANTKNGDLFYREITNYFEKNYNQQM